MLMYVLDTDSIYTRAYNAYKMTFEDSGHPGHHAVCVSRPGVCVEKPCS